MQQEMISNATCTKCQHCGELTNYASDPHHVARVERLERYELALNQIAARTGSDDPCRELVAIARSALVA